MSMRLSSHELSDNSFKAAIAAPLSCMLIVVLALSWCVGESEYLHFNDSSAYDRGKSERMSVEG